MSEPRLARAFRPMCCLVIFVGLACAAFGIEGQVFVVTEGASNIKLGLVAVGVYPRAVVEKYVAETKARCLLIVAQLRKEQREHHDAYVKLSANEKWEASLSELQLQQSALEKELMIYNFFFAGLPGAAAIAKTKTDADGRFKIDGVFPEDSLLVALASRKVGERTETYTWVLPPKEWASPLLLSNDNMFSISTFDPIPELFSGNEESRAAFYSKVKAEFDAAKARAEANTGQPSGASN